VFAFWLLARPGLTLVAAVLAIGLWTMVYGVVQITLSFEVKNLPKTIDRAFTESSRNGIGTAAKPRQDSLTPAAS